MTMRVPVSRLRPLSRTSRLQRQYHSYDHPTPSGPFNATEDCILSASIQHVPSHGFTQTSLTLGAKDVGYLDVSTNLFPKGPLSLVHYHLVTQRLALSKKVGKLQTKVDEKPLGVGMKVKALAWERLMSNETVIHRWQEALSILATPFNIPLSLHELAALADEIWFLSGDTSVDTTWYTKRATLSAIYASTELFMTTDHSSNFSETRQFLDRRFEDSFELGKMVGGVGQWAGFTAGAAINVLRSKGVRI